MDKYHKIDTVFMRDPSTNHKTLLIGQYSRPEFEYLADDEWIFTEKVDGTNIRVIIYPGGSVEFRGRTDDAQIPNPLRAFLVDKFSGDPTQMSARFPNGACLYGEGFGKGIQRNGENYSQVPKFVLFDVKINNIWLRRGSVESIAMLMDVPVVPIIGSGSLPDMVDMVRHGFSSRWGDFIAEGIVARPLHDIFDRTGNRVITKIKHRDFPGNSPNNGARATMAGKR